jgi:hypothetical protein
MRDVQRRFRFPRRIDLDQSAAVDQSDLGRWLQSGDPASCQSSLERILEAHGQRGLVPVPTGPQQCSTEGYGRLVLGCQGPQASTVEKIVPIGLSHRSSRGGIGHQSAQLRSTKSSTTLGI